MSIIRRVRVVWDGVKGLPAVSTFYFQSTEAGPDLTALSMLFESFKAAVPSGITWKIDGSGDNLDDTTGKIVGGWAGPTPPTITATGGNQWAGPVGGLITWRTGIVVNGRRPKGRTFIVPLASGAFSGQGQIGGNTVSPIQTVLNTIVQRDSAPMVVWTRPGPKGPGTSTEISEATLDTKPAVLTSRRD